MSLKIADYIKEYRLTGPAEKVRDYQTYGGEVAFIDNGINISHDEINGIIANTFDATTGSPIVTPLPCSDLHGMKVVSVAAAEGNNGFGYTGMMWDGAVTFVNVESMELGVMCVSTLEHQIAALDYLKQQGIEIAGTSIGLSLLTNQSGFEMYSEAARAFILNPDGSKRAVLVVAVNNE